MSSIFYIMATLHWAVGTSSTLDPLVRFLSYAWHLQRTWMWISQFQMLIQLSRRTLVGTTLATSMNTIKREWELLLWFLCATWWRSLLSLLIYVCYVLQGAFPLVDNGKSVIEVHQKKTYFIIPQNKLGQDIYIRPTEIKGFKDIVKMPSGDMRPVKVPVLTNMLDSHLRGELCSNPRIMVTVIVVDAQVPFCLKQRSHLSWCLFFHILLPLRLSCFSFYFLFFYFSMVIKQGRDFIWCHATLSTKFMIFVFHRIWRMCYME